MAVSSHQVSSSLSVVPEASVSELEEEAREIHTMATSGKFLDPKQDATEILTELKEMQQASKWKEAITGEPYDLDFLKDMMTQMDLRQELWKYIEVSVHSIREWKTILFRKLQTKKIMDKLTEWQAAAGQMKAYFPVSDELLAFWYRELQSFKNELPLLHKLAHDALK
ncbi:hypothetical protein NP493_59g03002 [Ridgeia piscesae]|uniref:Dynein heavy chain linker domain-containing protein n=1 Tax=Ridgeia piscesae TaxID=27915 RepID=A0AAD9UIW1_RIDPI|nr:hypothetical protein NP493_59g03002 [Ridgeia piscesae]